MRPNIVFTVLLLFLGGIVMAQPSNSNLYLFDYEWAESGAYQFVNPAYISADNKESYNNQPHFIEDELYFTAIYDKNQTDIYKCDIERKIRKRMTSTLESDYSARLMPDGKHFSVVRVATDATKAQQIWQYDIEGKELPKLLTPELDNVGYYEWVDAENLLLFLVGEPHKMVLYNLTAQTSRNLRREIGRCLAVKGDLAYFIDKRDKESMYLKEINLETAVIRSLIGTIEDSEDFALAPNGDLLMAKDSNLYKYSPDTDLDWILIADFSHYGITNIKRIAVNNDKIAIVDEKEMHTASND